MLVSRQSVSHSSVVGLRLPADWQSLRAHSMNQSINQERRNACIRKFHSQCAQERMEKYTRSLRTQIPHAYESSSQCDQTENFYMHFRIFLCVSSCSTDATRASKRKAFTYRRSFQEQLNQVQSFRWYKTLINRIILVKNRKDERKSLNNYTLLLYIWFSRESIFVCHHAFALINFTQSIRLSECGLEHCRSNALIARLVVVHWESSATQRRWMPASIFTR